MFVSIGLAYNTTVTEQADKNEPMKVKTSAPVVMAKPKKDAEAKEKAAK